MKFYLLIFSMLFTGLAISVYSKDTSESACVEIPERDGESIQLDAAHQVFFTDPNSGVLKYFSNKQLQQMPYLGALSEIHSADNYASVLLHSYNDNQIYSWTLIKLSDFSITQITTTERPGIIKIFNDNKVIYNKFSDPTSWVLLDLNSQTEESFDNMPSIYGYESNIVVPYDPTLTKIAVQSPPGILNIDTGLKLEIPKAVSIVGWSPQGNYVGGGFLTQKGFDYIFFQTSDATPIWYPSTNPPLEDLIGEFEYVTWSPDERYAVAKYTHAESFIYFYDFKTSEWLEKCYQVPSYISNLNWSHDLKYFWFLKLTTRFDETSWKYDLYVIDTTTGEYGIVIKDVGDNSFIGWVGNE